MLKYLVQSTEQLLSMMLMVALIFAYLKVSCGDQGRIFRRAGFIAGIAFSAVMTVMKTTTNKIDTGMWNLRTYLVCIAMLLVFLLAGLIPAGKKQVKTAVRAGTMTVMSAMLMLYFLPAYLENPHSILLTEQTVVSTAFILKMLGALGGLGLSLVAGIAVYKGAVRLSRGTAAGFMVAALLVNTADQVADSFSVMLAKRMIPTNHTLFVIAKHAANYSTVFIFAVLLICLIIPVMLWARSFKVNEPYDNPAEHRKIRAKWRSIRRWSSAVMVCAALAIATLTAGKAMANQKIELSPIEEARVDGDNVYVSFDQVSDGHLHRFGYTTDKGKTIRFIIIKKPNSSAYGIGLDACEICGETGYYEKDGQVVCNLCNVVMNINTIGFKGGCNPIVIPYSVADGNIIVPIEGLVEHEKIFK